MGNVIEFLFEQLDEDGDGYICVEDMAKRFPRELDEGSRRKRLDDLVESHGERRVGQATAALGVTRAGFQKMFAQFQEELLRTSAGAGKLSKDAADLYARLADMDGVADIELYGAMEEWRETGENIGAGANVTGA
jgi:hypothetical protein